jgi:hypothetical protein
MSNSEETKDKSPENIETPEAENKASETSPNKLLEDAMGLKDSNPKVFFGGIAAVVVFVLIVVMMSSGGGNKLPHKTFKPLAVGQQYTLKGANSTAGQSSVSMVAVPGVIAFDDTEEKGTDSSCNQQPEGTVVKVLAFQDFAGKKNAFANIEVLSEGKCKGRKGWTLAIDIQ